ncbi:hypothetical protein B0I72DRAFT_137906 [Yarrowia lipolytica]|nr:hypothetical protein YALI1_F09405g [Yarrowia lipolytica]KAB8284855.1 hypothetical protein BKA91DRAFT_134504 [Yarrowia lipolytica]KAE8174731.1 hypothetical protein BKA90DRAFT_133344 [Yarrowia lipolytica]QNQ01316.1 Putative di- and tripeptidase DUG2 [Yarrowia lipolytica]RDW24491.1 hypothetical protein B0I71DRAFT_134202 [Yarrowia lipolytica]
MVTSSAYRVRFMQQADLTQVDFTLSARKMSYPLDVGLSTCSGPLNEFDTPSPRLSPASFAEDRRGPGYKSKGPQEPQLTHKWRHDYSVVSLAANDKFIFAGTQNSDIQVFDVETFSLKTSLQGHEGCVYALSIATVAGDSSKQFLVSGGSDSLIKIWDIVELKEVSTVYSSFDVGDIFSVVYDPVHNMIFLGAQNASIQWIELGSDTGNSQTVNSEILRLPSYRFDRFFDSRGPGGKTAPQQLERDDYVSIHGQKPHEHALLQIPSENAYQYAHNGYVYCLVCVENFVWKDNVVECVLISGGGDAHVNFWSWCPQKKDLVLIASIDCETSVQTLCVSDSMLYCGTDHGDVKIWDLGTLQLIRQDTIGTSPVVSLSTSGDCVFKGSEGGLQRWSLKGERTATWLAHEGTVQTTIVRELKGRTYLISGGNDGVAIWDITVTDSEHSQQIAKARQNFGFTNDRLISTLFEFVAFRTVSSHGIEYGSDSRRCAIFLRDLLRDFGAHSSLLAVPDKNPVVLGTFSANKSDLKGAKPKRLLFYGHYDVIPAHETDGWDTYPYTITPLDGYLYGRGVSDNKGPVLATIFAVAEAFAKGELGVDVVFLVEGEEECGSPGFEDVIDKNDSMIGDIDYILLCNSYWLDDTTPCINYGLRGVLHATVEVYSDNPDLHSGVEGGATREPTIDLIRLLALLTTPEGDICLPDFYKKVKPPTESEEKRFEHIIKTSHKPLTKASIRAKWALPSLTVHRFNVSGPGNLTVIPKSAQASVSLRIVPDQDADEIKQIFTEYMQDKFAEHKSPNHLKISVFHQADPWIGDIDTPVCQVLRSIVTEVWGVEPLLIREGGSIPVMRFLEKRFNASAIQFPCGQSSDHAHLNNERLRIINLINFRRILMEFFTKIQ